MYCLVLVIGTGWVRKWGKEQATGYEACAWFMAINVSEKYQSQIHWSLEHLEIFVAF
jgi:hypothetical protein